MRICKDCLHYEAPNTCRQLDLARINPVDGKLVLRACDIERALGSQCGPEGKLWQAKASDEDIAAQADADRDAMAEALEREQEAKRLP